METAEAIRPQNTGRQANIISNNDSLEILTKDVPAAE
jgi:hypothetical protein